MGPLLARRAEPQLILCISAHWLTRGWQVTGMASPGPSTTSAAFRRSCSTSSTRRPAHRRWRQPPGSQPGHRHPASRRGRQRMGPGPRRLVGAQADVSRSRHPRDAAEHGLFRAAGRALRAGRSSLKALRERGVLIVGSGNIVHNLRATRRGARPAKPTTGRSSSTATWPAQVEKGDLAALADFQQLGPVAQLAHPTHDHYLPLLHAAGRRGAATSRCAFSTPATSRRRSRCAR